APNAAGILRVIQQLGGASATYEELLAGKRDDLKKLKAGWIVGLYGKDWVPKDQPAAWKKGYRVAQDCLPNALTDSANVVLPAAAWAETEGCWENYQGKLQAFAAAIAPPDGVKRAGDVYMTMLGRRGLYNAASIRAEMGEPFASVKLPEEKGVEPAMEF